MPPLAVMRSALLQAVHYGGLIGPLAILVREPGQVRKEAAAANDVCAGMPAGSSTLDEDRRGLNDMP